MHIQLLVIGRTTERYLQDGIDIYLNRLSHYINFDLVVIPALKDTRGASPDEIKEREAPLILNRLAKSDVTTLLDEHGQSVTSVDFAQYLQRQLNRGTRQLSFVIGGAYGFAPSIYHAATDKIALSPMTFNHQMVRLIFMEQLYRGFTILHNEPYHNS